MKLEKNAKALLIFDVFKGQTTSVVNELLRKIDLVITHVSNNYKNLFQPLDISVNKGVKCYLSGKYQDWYTEKVLEQLNRGVNTHDVKVNICLSTIKPFHAKWMIDMFKFKKESNILLSPILWRYIFPKLL